MDVYSIRLGEGGYLQMPWWWFDVVLVWLGVMGICLWAFGRSLARGMCVVGGVGLGGVTAWLVVRCWMPDAPVALWVMGSGVVSGVLCFVLSRMVIASALAMVLAMGFGLGATWIAPPAQDTFGPGIHEAWLHIATTVEASSQQVHEAQQAGRKPDLEQMPRIEPILGRAVGQVNAAVGRTLSASGWLSAILLVGLSVLGAVVGFLAGIQHPKAADTLVTAMYGSALIMAAMARVLMGYGPEFLSNRLPHSTSMWFLLVSVVALWGVALQGYIWRGEYKEDDGEKPALPKPVRRPVAYAEDDDEAEEGEEDSDESEGDGDESVDEDEMNDRDDRRA